MIDVFLTHTACFSAPVSVHMAVSLCSPFPAERQHLGSVSHHLSRINTQQLAPGVQPLCTQIQGDPLPQLLVTWKLSRHTFLCSATLADSISLAVEK